MEYQTLEYYKNMYEQADKLAEVYRNEITDLQEENSRLHEVLKKYASRDNWIQVYDYVNYGCTAIPDGFKFDDYDIIDIENEPWKLAQEALKL